jgi:hypothetical protein
VPGPGLGHSATFGTSMKSTSDGKITVAIIQCERRNRRNRSNNPTACVNLAGKTRREHASSRYMNTNGDDTRTIANPMDTSGRSIYVLLWKQRIRNVVRASKDGQPGSPLISCDQDASNRALCDDPRPFGPGLVMSNIPKYWILARDRAIDIP